MKRKFLIPVSLALAASAAALLGACKAADTDGTPGAASAASQPSSKAAPPTATTEVYADGARRVSPAELQQMVEAGKVAIYDTRSKESYDLEHVKGSLSMPSNEVDARAGEFPKGKTLVFYCTWPNEHTSAGAVLTLKAKGIEDAAALLGGMTAWKNAGLATEGSAVSK